VLAAPLGLVGELGVADGLAVAFFAVWCRGEAAGLAGALAMPE
jgi:hypothetical protein